MATSVPLPMLLSLTLLGCSGGTKAAEAEKAQKAAAEAKAADEAAARERKEAREAEEKAQEQAEQAKKAALEELVALPESVPKTLDVACAQMVEAYDKYMRTVLTGDQLTKWETGGNEMQTTVFKRACLKDTPEIAACQAHAFSKATPEMRDRIPDFMRLCKEEFGTPSAP